MLHHGGQAVHILLSMQFVRLQKGKWFISKLWVWGLIKHKKVSELNLKHLFQPIRWLVSEERSCCVTSLSLRVQVKPQWFGESCGAAEASTAARSPDTPDTWTLNTQSGLLWTLCRSSLMIDSFSPAQLQVSVQKLQQVSASLPAAEWLCVFVCNRGVVTGYG